MRFALAMKTWLYVGLTAVLLAAAIIQKLNDATVATMDAPDVQAKLEELGIEVVVSERRSPEYLANFVVHEIAKWAGPIKAAGVSMD